MDDWLPIVFVLALARPELINMAMKGAELEVPLTAPVIEKFATVLFVIEVAVMTP